MIPIVANAVWIVSKTTGTNGKTSNASGRHTRFMTGRRMVATRWPRLQRALRIQALGTVRSARITAAIPLLRIGRREQRVCLVCRFELAGEFLRGPSGQRPRPWGMRRRRPLAAALTGSARWDAPPWMLRQRPFRVSLLSPNGGVPLMSRPIIWTCAVARYAVPLARPRFASAAH